MGPILTICFSGQTIARQNKLVLPVLVMRLKTGDVQNMVFILPRTRRVLDALLDPMSYRLLQYARANRLVSLKSGKIALTPSGEFGLPAISEQEVANDSGAIPKIIFQTWKSHHEMPDNYAYWRASFSRNNPGYRCLLWDDADNRQFIAEKFPWFLTRYDSYPREILRADIIRLFFLYTYGGFYADMDSECVQSLEDMRTMGDVLLGRMGRDREFEHSIPNAIMASKSRQAFWLLTIALAIERLGDQPIALTGQRSRIEWLTGPVLLKDAVRFYMSHPEQAVRERIAASCPELAAEVSRSKFGQIRLLPRTVWYPINWNNFLHTVLRKKMFSENGVVDKADLPILFPKAYIVTYWTASWK
jgi:inositol phosphorylceramide mannosyltransferase catalytic subunit